MKDIIEQIKSVMPVRLVGMVVSTNTQTIIASDFPAPIGSIAQIEGKDSEPLLAEVIAFRENSTILYSYSNLTGIRPGSRIKLVRTIPWLPVGEELLGRVINAFGNVIDGGPQPVLPDRVRYIQKPPDPYHRPPIATVLSTGVRAIDAVLTCGSGQRLGIFSGSGIGKSVTLGMMARYTNADVIVIAMIGERGREISEFVENTLGEQGRQKSILVAATSDEPALTRIRAAQAAMAIAEYFRDRGKNVLFLMDSLTRFAMAQRELGLAAGESASSRGYTPSVFSLLPQLVERAGRTPSGSITAFFTVLVEGDDKQDPIGDAVRGLLDGHIWLSRKLSTRGHYPPIDILESISRVMQNICSPQHWEYARELRRLMGIYSDNEDLISVGAYRAGTNTDTDHAIKMKPLIDQFLQQGQYEQTTFDESLNKLKNLFLS